MAAILPPTFPPEVCEIFVNFLHGDHRALAACSLVCRDWVPTSRPHLFHSIRVTSGNHERLWQLLRSQDVSFLRYARVVEFQAPWQLCANICPYLQPELVESLSLVEIRLSEADCLSIIEIFPSVLELSLTGNLFWGSAYLYRLLTGFPAIRSLVILKYPLVDFSAGMTDTGSFFMPMTLQSIRLADDTTWWHPTFSDIMLGWLLSHTVMPDIRSLTICGLAAQFAPNLSALLHRLWNVLDELELSVGGDKMIDRLDRDFTQHFDLSVLSRLRVICLVHCIGDQENGWIYDALSQIGPSVEHIELTLTFSSFDEIVNLWRPIHGISNARDLPFIRELHVRIQNTHPLRNSQDMQATLTDQLSEYNTRGILSFEQF